MCIVIYDNRKSKETLDKVVFQRSQEKNPHGIGLMYAFEDKLHIWKTLDDFKGLWQRYLFARKRECKVAIHFRKATEGTVKEDNLHPFTIAPGFAFMHNGTVKDIASYVPKGESDTRFINTELFQKFPGDFLQSPIHRVMIENLIDGGRMFFMDSSGNFSIINETRWGAKWVDGVWYSKGEHLPYYLKGSNIPWVGSYTGWKSNLWTYESEADLYDVPSSAIEIKEVKTITTHDIIPFKPTKKEKKRRESKSAKKLRRKLEVKIALQDSKARIPSVMGPKVDMHANLIFDYGYLSRTGFYDDRIKEVQNASLDDHQLWAIGDMGAEMPAVLPMPDVTMHGILYKVTKDYKIVIDDVDQCHGCDFHNPGVSVFHRRWVKVNINIGKPNATTVWAWVYRFALSLNEVGSASIVPFGDWSRWCTSVQDYPIPPIQQKKELSS